MMITGNGHGDRKFELPVRYFIGEVVADFQASDFYTGDFLVDLEDGLRKSSYTKHYKK